jgi:hypothetical protein
MATTAKRRAAPRPPVSRAAMPRGRHAKTGPNAPARGRHAAPAAPQPQPSPRTADQQRRSGNSARRASAAARTSAQTARKGVTVTRAGIQHGGQHALMAEFILFCGIVGMRAVADYVPGGEQNDGTAKGSMTPPAGQLGPLPVLAAGIVFFFVLSFLAARGGGWAKIAAVSGLIMDVALLMRSAAELNTVSQAFTNATQSGQAAGNAQPGGTQALGGHTNPVS